MHFSASRSLATSRFSADVVEGTVAQVQHSYEGRMSFNLSAKGQELDDKCSFAMPSETDPTR